MGLSAGTGPEKGAAPSSLMSLLSLLRQLPAPPLVFPRGESFSFSALYDTEFSVFRPWLPDVLLSDGVRWSHPGWQIYMIAGDQ